MYLINDFMIYFTCKSNSFVLISVVSSTSGTTCKHQMAWAMYHFDITPTEIFLHLRGDMRGN